jgi:hypothetical protein
VVSAYRIEGNGRPQVERPTVGPCADRDDRLCEIRVKHWRMRKTGPCCEVLVLRCETHGVGFTVYPPGHVPYGRRCLVSLSTDGSRVERDRGTGFEKTLFEGAMDAAEGVFWAKESEGGSLHARYNTQLRHVNRGCELLGLIRAGPPEARVKRMSMLLEIGGVRWEEARVLGESGNRVQAKGQGIRHILTLIPQTMRSFEGLASLGYDAGIWPRMQVWDARSGKLRRSPFPWTERWVDGRESGGLKRPTKM